MAKKTEEPTKLHEPEVTEDPQVAAEVGHVHVIYRDGYVKPDLQPGQRQVVPCDCGTSFVEGELT